MDQHNASISLKARRSWITWVVMGIVFLLGVIALIVVLEDIAVPQRSVPPWTLGLDFVTGLTGIIGALGYATRKRWGLYAFGVSVLGHFISHIMLMVSAIMNNRVSVSSIGGLSVIPIIAMIALVGMVRDEKRA